MNNVGMASEDARPGSTPPLAGGAPPPHDLDAERAVLGAILISERSLYGLVIEEGLKAEHFYDARHRLIYEAMLALYDESEAVDSVTVCDRLRRSGKLEEAGGEDAVERLHAEVPSVGSAPEYARIVVRTARLRALLHAALTAAATARDGVGDPDEVLSRIESELLSFGDDERRQVIHVGESLHAELDRLHELSVRKTALTGVPSGFKDVDDLTGGFQPGNLIIVAARPSMGKSTLVCNIAENAALEGRPVLLFSLEMSESELAQRFVASQARIPGEQLQKGMVPEDRWPRILKAAQQIADAPLYIDDSSDMGLVEVRAKARRLHGRLEGGLGMIVVDYLQLMRIEARREENRVVALGELSRGMKLLARELKVPVVLLSQLSRAVEQRRPQIPQLSDLRESGAIEQDADLVGFIYRDDYYNEDSDRVGEADLIIAKHRNGRIGTVTLTFQKDFPKFFSYAGERFRDAPPPPDSEVGF